MTNRFEKIEKKLEGFIRKYYTNELLRGAILFFALGLFYFLITLLIEYFFWLSPAGRTVLFWAFIVVEVALLIKFIIVPLARLFKLSKGINYKDAASLIGNYFPEVSDKLINTLQLHNEVTDSELMLASIEQKSEELEPIPFRLAIDFKKNKKYLKYAAIPVVIFLIANYAGKEKVFSTSYERVVNYNEAYEPPALFSFYVVNENLQAIENKDFELRVRTLGDVIPEEASVRFNDEVYFLQQIALGEYSYIFEKPTENITFNLKGNKVVSQPYTIEVLKVPVLMDFDMELNYPAHTRKGKETVKNTGNAIIPEGTTVSWNISTRQTEGVDLVLKDTIIPFALSENVTTSKVFKAVKRIYNNTSYEVSTSNSQLKNYENLAYNLQVIKDQYPQISLEAKKDTVNEQQNYFYGKVSDDYGLKKLQIVYYPAESDNKQYEEISISKGNVDQFIYAFPNNLDLQEGVNYEYYFEVFDNDAIHRFKSTKSTIYSFVKLTDDELKNKQLEQQQKSIGNLDKSLQKMKDSEKELQEISRTQKEKKQLSFNDQKKLDSFLKRQKQQEEMMKDFSKQLKENLDEFQKEEELTDEDKEKLKERLERQEKKAKENEKLLKELQKLREKMPKEELSEKLEELEKQNKNNKRNLEQMVELTKRYYVQKKTEQIARDLEELAKKQEDLSNKEGKENTKEKQDELNEEFKKLEEALKDLEKENQELKKPMDLPGDEKKQEEIKEEQQGASDELEKQEDQEQQDGTPQDKSSAQQKQKKAAEKMKQMSQSMQSQMQMDGEESLEEDTEMLRQILDNLLVFSFEEEAIMMEFRKMDDKNPNYARKLRRQNVLKQNFRHIDDSLYALSLRQPKLDEIINETLVDIDYSMDQALLRLAENQIMQGVSSQQYVITGTNKLADFLSQTLDNMQNAMMSSSGSGKGKGMGMGSGSGNGQQLPDIIQSQEELNKKMGEGKKPGEGKEGEGKEGESGEGSEGKDGQGKEGGEQPRSEGEGGKEGQGEGGQGGGKGSSNGDKNGEGSDGEGNGKEGDAQSDEYEQGLLYEIYKEQSKLRQQLEDAIQKEGLGDNAKKLVKDMKDVEQQLLDKGFNNETLQRMTNLKHELLKLKEATLQQGEENKREANTNLKEFANPVNSALEKAKKYFNTTEILNRNALPLKEEYKRKVQDYFQKNND
ncbi:hypothetical protein DCS32_06120 [Dokdonia sp. Dokd-P16]|uniref:DUF4175 family protein n=1 Tax=Dokdonia sp. Dokd-P16 TaxID=2173169 RepID=UPI000D54687F|nr:DUF4175 family protein [Dokdonia sp. Dokd-P16]AWH73745.1 hypothetical protein DCS32_06120 [Dokdonia sp. Dokd-P16]